MLFHLLQNHGTDNGLLRAGTAQQRCTVQMNVAELEFRILQQPEGRCRADGRAEQQTDLQKSLFLQIAQKRFAVIGRTDIVARIVSMSALVRGDHVIVRLQIRPEEFVKLLS